MAEGDSPVPAFDTFGIRTPTGQIRIHPLYEDPAFGATGYPCNPAHILIVTDGSGWRLMIWVAAVSLNLLLSFLALHFEHVLLAGFERRLDL